MIETVNNKKSDLRAKETEYIELYTKLGTALYNGENSGFLHVKMRRLKKNDAKRRLSKENKENVPGTSKLLKGSQQGQCTSNGNMEGNKQGAYANELNTSNGTKGNDIQPSAKRPASESLDENRQSGQSFVNNAPILRGQRHRGEDDTRPLDDWYLFCDGEISSKDSKPYYCPGACCGKHLIIPLSVTTF